MTFKKTYLRDGAPVEVEAQRVSGDHWRVRVGDAVHECQDGKPGAKLEDCDVAAGKVCSDGSCLDACEVAEGAPSNLGCEFWAVDLPNERGFSSAANLPWGLVLSNASGSSAEKIPPTHSQ